MEDNTSYTTSCMTVKDGPLFLATRANKGKWWVKKFLNNLEKLEIKNNKDTIVLILSGTHGDDETFKTCLNNAYLAEKQFFENDKLNVKDLQGNERTNEMVFEVLDLGDYTDHTTQYKLGLDIKALEPNIVILAFCHSEKTLEREDDPVRDALVTAGLLQPNNSGQSLKKWEDMEDIEDENPLFGTMYLPSDNESQDSK